MNERSEAGARRKGERKREENDCKLRACVVLLSPHVVAIFSSPRSGVNKRGRAKKAGEGVTLDYGWLLLESFWVGCPASVAAADGAGFFLRKLWKNENKFAPCVFNDHKSDVFI